MRTQLKRTLEKRWVFHELKTRRSRRQIALASPAVAALQRHQEQQQIERATLGAAYEDNGLVFCTQLGRPLIKGNVYRGFLQLLGRAALPACASTICATRLRRSC